MQVDKTTFLDSKVVVGESGLHLKFPAVATLLPLLGCCSLRWWPRGPGMAMSTSELGKQEREYGPVIRKIPRSRAREVFHCSTVSCIPFLFHPWFCLFGVISMID